MAETSHYLILFCDLVGSTEVAVEASPLFFARTYIASFHWAAYKALKFVQECQTFGDANFSRKIDKIHIAGDEVHAFIPLDFTWAPRDLEDLVASTISFAYVTKLFWLAAPYNLQRMLRHQFPRDISVGIHIGQAAPVQNSEDSDVAGLHINVTKRIESKARDAKESRIFASRDVTEIFERWRRRTEWIPRESRPPLWLTNFFPQPPISGKGVPKKLEVLELGQAKGRLNDFADLVQQLEDTPETVDVSAESAVRIMAEIFIPPGLAIFKDDAATLSIDHELAEVNTVEGYIDKWFRAIDMLPKIFLDERWLLFNCFLVSCALIRHTSVGRDKRPEYQRIGKTVVARLGELIERQLDP